jgi:myo-inositol-1(or 4)-monophosphatase
MLKTLEKIVYRAAKEIEKISTLKVVSKGEIGNIVTRADLKSEEIITDGLRKKFPNCHIWSEERFSKITKENFEKWNLLFIIDPLDGTTNYAFSIPQSAISVGVYEFGKPKCGIVYDIFGKKIYKVEIGKGVFVNDQKIRRKKVRSLKEAVIGSSFAYGERPKEVVKKWSKLVGKVATLRVMGSAVLDLVMTATGQFTCYIHNSLKPFDVGAGLIMLKEMGVKVTNWMGKEFTVFDEKIIAAPPEIYDEFYSLIFGTKKKNG